MIRVRREKGALRVVADQTMSPTATADVARVLLRMLAEGCAPGLYHVVNDGAATWFELAREIVRLAGVEAAVTPCSSREYPARAARPHYSVLDNTRISAAFGTMPPWWDALERYLRAKGHRNLTKLRPRSGLRSMGGPYARNETHWTGRFQQGGREIRVVGYAQHR